MRPTFHIVGSLRWVPSEAAYAVADGEANIFQYDVGVESGLVWPLARGWEFRPFAGIGAGARTYVYNAAQLKDRTCLTGYGALGSEFRLGRMAFRLEARDNVFCYKSPVSGIGSKTRNDVSLALGLAYHFQ